LIAFTGISLPWQPVDAACSGRHSEAPKAVESLTNEQKFGAPKLFSSLLQ
jgi:hypothetical protein